MSAPRSRLSAERDAHGRAADRVIAWMAATFAITTLALELAHQWSA